MEATIQSCKKVVFVTGMGHSGTTLLGMMLGAGKENLYGGEMVNSQFLKDETVPLAKRTCRTCGVECPIWNTITIEGNVYEVLSKKTGKSVIIDSSKKPLSWIEEQLPNLTDCKPALVILIRDSRAIIASKLRRHPYKGPRKFAREWSEQMKACDTLALSFPGPVVRVMYEELAALPEKTLRTVCDQIGIPFEEAMLDPWDAGHHPLRGNKGTQSISNGTGRHLPGPDRQYYESHPRAIVLDERWQSELNEDALKIIERETGEQYGAYMSAYGTPV